MTTILEGLWEEIVAQGDVLKGKRVRVEVLEEVQDKPSKHPLDALVGLIPPGEGPSDLSTHHDEYLYRRP